MAKTLALFLTSLLTATILFTAFNNNLLTNDKKQLIEDILQPQIPYIFNTECTESLVVQCAVDIELTVKNCAAAFETGGANIIADIKCAKDLMADKKHCWPCICAEAKKKGWKIIGC